jgi:hypothetical protein
MKITKKLETRLDISSKDMYCPDYNKNFMQILNTKYLNRCYKSIYITDILQILNRSPIHCKTKTLDGEAYVDILFEVSGIVYEEEEIIHNCKVIEILNDSMIAKSEHASLQIKIINNSTVFKKGTEIPVIVKKVRYKPFEQGISVIAIPFVPIKKPIIYYKISSDQTNVAIVNKSTQLFDFKNLDKIIDTLKSLKKNKISYKFFQEFIYPYKKYKQTPGKGTSLSLDNLNKLKTGDVVYQPESYLDDDNYYLLNEKDIVKLNPIFVEIDKSQFIYHILNLYQKNLIKLIDFIQLYDTKEKIKEKEDVWKMYALFKED